MPRFRRKPHEIDAAQWYPGTKVKGVCEKTHRHENPVGSAHVHTRTGSLVYPTAGQYIVPDGKYYYPCDQDIFERTYEPAEEVEQVYEVEQPPPRLERAPVGGMIFQPNDDENDEGDEELRGRAMSLAEEADEIARQYVSGR